MKLKPLLFLGVVFFTISFCAAFSLKAQNVPAYDTTRKVNGNKTEITVRFQNGNLKEIIRLKNDKKHGLQESYYVQGLLMEKSTFKNGFADGALFRYDNQGNLIEKREYLYDKSKGHSVLHGTYEAYANKALVKKVKYKDSLMEGKYQEFHPNGKPKTIAYYKTGLLRGEKKELNSNGVLVSLENYEIVEDSNRKKSVLSGEATYYDYKGMLTKKGNYLNGKEDGVWKFYHNNSDKIKSITTYKNGKQHGLYENYYASGTIQNRGILFAEIDVNGKLTKNVKHGRIEQYTEAGFLTSIEEYDMGKRSGVWSTYQKNGILLSSRTYVDGFISGPETFYDTSGNKTNETNYKLVKTTDTVYSIKEGPETKWIKGVIVSETFFENGLEHGTRKNYFKDGTLSSQAEYKEGVLAGKYFEYYPNGMLKTESNHTKNYNYYGKPKSDEVGWRKDYDTMGQLIFFYFTDSVGQQTLLTKYTNGIPTERSYSKFITLTYFPGGGIMAIDLGDRYQPVFGARYYVDKTLRHITFQNKEKMYVSYADFTYRGELNKRYTQAHQNPDSLVPSAETVMKYAVAIGNKLPDNPFFTDSVPDGSYTLSFTNGKPWVQMQFKNGIPHGTFTCYDAINGDTLLHKEFSEGTQNGYFVEKFAGENIVSRGWTRPNGKLLWVERNKMDGTPVSKEEFDEDKRTLLKEYHNNGILKLKRNEVTQEYAQYDEQGNLLNDNQRLSDTPSFYVQREYYPGSGRLRKVSYMLNKKGDSTETYYYEDGSIKYRYTYENGNKNGPYIEYDEAGKLKKSGRYVNGKQHGLWTVVDKGKTDTLYFKNGSRVLAPLYAQCACADTSYGIKTIGFAPSLDMLLPYEEVKKSMFPAFHAVDSFNFNSIFYNRLVFDNNHGSGFSSMDLILLRELAFLVPAAPQLKVTLNPCRTPGYLDKLPITANYSTGGGNDHRIILRPKKISIELINSALKSEDPDYSNVTALYNASSIEYNGTGEFELTLPENAEKNACFTKAKISNFLSVEIKAAAPMVFTNPGWSDYHNINKLELSSTELDNFFGFEVSNAVVHFPVLVGDVGHTVNGVSDYMLAGGNLVAGIVKVTCEKTAENVYVFNTGSGKITLSAAELAQQWSGRGFTGLNINYDEVLNQLFIYFKIK